MEKNKVSLFLPVYNEERILGKNISKIFDVLKELRKNFEIIIVDDGSSDNTHKACKKMCANNNRIRYIRYNNGPSRRENLAKSFKKAKGDIIAFMDMDLATDISHTKRLFEEIEKGADIAIGSRNIRKAYIKRTLFRRSISYLYNLFMRIYFNSHILDHQCGFKAFKKDVILNLIQEMDYDYKFIRGWFWDTELLLRAQKKHYKIIELPVRWKMGEKSEFNVNRELRMIPYILKLKNRIK